MASAWLEGVDYFDGISAAAQSVAIRIDAGELCIESPATVRRIPLRHVRWPERTRHGRRVADLDGGGSVQARDAAAWDAWMAQSGVVEPLAVRLQQSWRWSLASLVAVSVLLTLLWWRGIPWLALAAVEFVPQRVDVAVGKSALAAIDRRMMQPSRLPAAEQQRLRDAFAGATARLPVSTVPMHQLVFRRSTVGPNAFALPGGTLVMTDELVELVEREDAVLIGVLGHELGHVRHRHGMRMLVQAMAHGALATLVLGDISSILATAPVLLTQASYSRDAEREADHEAVRVLRASGLSPGVMTRLFERLAAAREGREKTGAEATPKESTPKESTPKESTPKEATAAEPASRESPLGISIATHPADAERIRFFLDAAR